MNIEINNNFYIFVGFFASSIICYGVYLCCHKMQHRMYQYNMPRNVVPYEPDHIIPHDEPIHMNPIPPPYTETSDDIIMLPPPYTI